MSKERILVVDDEKGVVRSCTRILQRQDFTVTGRTDSQTVPELLKQETFDLLLTDIRMPKIDGLELLRIAKEIDPHITVILITGYGTMEDAIKAIRLGAQGFLMKPFEPEELVATVQESLRRRALIRDSLHLQTLLPFLEINQMLQVSGGEVSLVRRALEIVHRETGATRLAWLSLPQAMTLDSPLISREQEQTEDLVPSFVEAAVVPQQAPPSHIPEETLKESFDKVHPIWVLSDGSQIEKIEGHPNVVAALWPIIIKGEVVGLLTAETGQTEDSGPFNKLSLDLLSLLRGQLAIIIENIQLFQQAETLRTFNEDIIQNMTNGLIATNRRGEITAFNPAAAKMLGVEKALNQALEKVTYGGEELVQLFENTLKTGVASTREEVTVYQENGSKLPISVSTAPLLTGEENLSLVGVVGVLEDLSEMKALESERRRLDRLVALGEMSAVVAHEIRNPIAGIAAGVEYLTRNMLPDSTEHQGAKMIQGEIKRINRILEDILFVARPLKLNLSEENLPEVIESVIERCVPQMNQNQVTTSLEHKIDLPPVAIDRQRLEQVLMNLIINATQAMRNGGQIVLKIEWADLEKKAVSITVADDGPGIPSDIHPRIFEPFFTTKVRGTGLGLTVAHRIIEEHGGTIQIESEEKKGTSFMITLPIKRDTTS